MWEGPLLDLDARVIVRDNSRRSRRGRWLWELRHKEKESWRSRLARELVALGLWLDPKAGGATSSVQSLSR